MLSYDDRVEFLKDGVAFIEEAELLLARIRKSHNLDRSVKELSIIFVNLAEASEFYNFNTVAAKLRELNILLNGVTHKFDSELKIIKYEVKILADLFRRYRNMKISA